MANTKANTGLSGAIRLVLQAAGTPLAVADILEALPTRLAATPSTVAAICGQRAKAGEFLAEMDGAKITYSLNPNWNAEPASRGPRGSATVAAAAEGAERVRAGNPHAMAERLASIAQDIDDALRDACDAQLPHELIKGLVVANGAIARSARLVRA